MISEKTFQEVAMHLNVEVATIKAVQTVESGGKGFVVPGKPTILFEGHIFWQELSKRKIDPSKHVPGNEDILYPKWTKQYYKGGLSEYTRLEKAVKINEDAALASASWGMFQIMGSNYALCGKKNVKDFVAAMQESEDQQLSLFITFIENNHLDKYLKNKDWQGFAQKYNGPRYAENKYDLKLQNAYDKYRNV